MPTPGTIRVVAAVRQSLAGDALTGRQAKLYSQRLRREMGQPGLVTFSPADIPGYVEEAMWLIECALIERSGGPNDTWRLGIKRAAEILEFLTQQDLRPADSPLHLLSAASYQVAGFPAMALAQLARMPEGEPFSVVLREFIRASFPAALDASRLFWRSEAAANAADLPSLSALAVRHTVMCIGTVCMYFKTGDRQMVDRAIVKLEAIARGYLHSRDPFSYLLARLTALTGASFVESALWNSLGGLAVDDDTRAALQQFGRSAFTNRRALIWPAQAAGITRLREPASFVLCTPTGSGKTMVATLAVVQALFTRPQRPRGLEHFEPDNLILYIVPSRALAAEVEKRLAEDLHGIAAQPVVVTGLYGGIDWGPTDAWIQTEGPTIVICTFEKADALLRYLGVLFLHRVRLVVIDEAHMVEHSGAPSSLMDGTSRQLRLELLGTRLLEAKDRYGFRMIALSAVAANAAPALARWIEGAADARPTTSAHRSTRQMVGSIEVGARGQFNVRYDLMNGRSLRFEDERRHHTPFVRTPFPPMPGAINFAQPDKAMRAPTLWAALHLAAERPDGSRPSVLISVTQHIEAFASDCIDRLEEWSAEAQLPQYRDRAAGADDLWRRCLASAADYFGTASVEYRLLEHGVAVHHGKMPGLMARRLKTLMDRGFVRIIIATSTLSEGVNIPVTYLLLPSVFRANARLSLQEFTNLIGRAGRPGVSTEGHALVVLPEQGAVPVIRGRRYSRQRTGYEALVAELERTTTHGAAGRLIEAASSPLAQLLSALAEAWRELVGRGTPDQFTEWLEQTSAIAADGAVPQAIDYLDSLDAFLIASVQELEELRGQEVPAAEMEEYLIRIWRRSYAFAAVQEEDRLRGIWLNRGRVIKQRYPDAAVRRQIYRTSLSPRSALTLVARIDAIRARLIAGAGYAAMGTDQRLGFVGDILELIAEVPSFRISRTLGQQRDYDGWREVLRWWLAKGTLVQQPTASRVTAWYDFASKNFIYRGAWGLGSVLSLLLDSGEDGRPIAALEIDDWPLSGLPWIAFWLKELLTWGTLEPVAAYLLARGDAVDRPQAETDAGEYYRQLPDDVDDNEKLNPRRVRDWLNERAGGVQVPRAGVPLTVGVELTRDPAAYVNQTLNVMHFETDGRLQWIDAAGYSVARSPRPRDWPDATDRHHFQLNVASSRVDGALYLPHV